MSVRTQWHLAELAESDDDPFGSVVYSTGIDIDLTASPDELAEAFKRLLLREGRMAQRGLTCELKDKGQNCLSCPAATLDASEDRSRLCRLGKDQATIERACLAESNERHAEFEEMFNRTIAEFEELAHAMRPADVDELLTSVGL